VLGRVMTSTARYAQRGTKACGLRPAYTILAKHQERDHLRVLYTEQVYG
jgi:hypothetical protein